MRACGYLPPIWRYGPPKLEKCEAWYKQCLRNFVPFFGLCTPLLKYCRRAKFRTGALPPVRDMAKKRVCCIGSFEQSSAVELVPFSNCSLTHSLTSALQHGRPAVDLRPVAYHISQAACRLRVASVFGQSQACNIYIYVHAYHVISSLSVSQCESVTHYRQLSACTHVQE